MSAIKKVGLIINPIAGMGGRVGLKGTDEAEIVEKAIELGAIPEAPEKAIKALKELLILKDEIEILTLSGEMGEIEAEELGFKVKLIGNISSDKTTREDTINAAKKLLEENVDLLLFAGGDGTARDIYKAVGTNLVAIGIPTGVKMHSAVYGATPSKSGELALQYLQNKIRKVQDVEVMDIDEEAFRQGIVTAKLFGYLKVPSSKKFLQGLKCGAILNEKVSKEAVAVDIIDNMQEDIYYLIGPGSTTVPIMKKLNLSHTLLGIDVIYNKKVIQLDATEEQILKIINDKPFKIIVTPIGGQGYIFGRGNQQISPRVIEKAGKENIIVVAVKQKIYSLGGKEFLVDTGSSEIDKMLQGYINVVVGYGERIIYKIG